MSIKHIFIIFFIFSFLSCGYHFTLQETLRDRKQVKTLNLKALDIEKVCIMPFINRTPQRGLENLLTNALVYKFNTGQGVEVTDKARADAFLSGEIITYETMGVAYTQTKYTATGRVTVGIKVRLEDKKGILIWENPYLSDQEEFQIGSNAAQTEDNRNIAIRRILQRMAERIYEELITMY